MRRNLYRPEEAKRSVNLTLGAHLGTGTRTAGLNLYALKEETAAAALARRERGRVQAAVSLVNRLINSSVVKQLWIELLNHGIICRKGIFTMLCKIPVLTQMEAKEALGRT